MPKEFFIHNLANRDKIEIFWPELVLLLIAGYVYVSEALRVAHNARLKIDKSGATFLGFLCAALDANIDKSKHFNHIRRFQHIISDDPRALFWIASAW